LFYVIVIISQFEVEFKISIAHKIKLCLIACLKTSGDCDLLGKIQLNENNLLHCS